MISTSAPSRRLALLAGSALLLLAAGCGRHDHAHDEHAHDDHGHSHDARHGGVPVILGDEIYHVEITHGERPGTLRAYFFDGHMEHYVRVASPSFAARATVSGVTHPLEFVAVADTDTGESVGDTSTFEAEAAWLTPRPALELHIPHLTVRGMTFTGITASLPAGVHP